MIHITNKVLSIPPYLSTSWDNILSIRLAAENVLIVQLKGQAHAEVPNLTGKQIQQIFEAHARHLESHRISEPFSFTLPVNSSEPTGTLLPSMQHNPLQADLPPLPPRVLEKIAGIAKAFGLEGASILPPAEPHCNCAYCQIARTLQEKSEDQEREEEVSDEDLKFRNWDVQPKGEKLYLVANPLDANEYYTVFLGSPIGCTCGSKNCEHIRAALDS